MTIVQRKTEHGCGCDRLASESGLLDLDEAMSLIRDHVAPASGVQRLPLAACLGRVLAEPVRALADMPRFNHSAMDGYALRIDDLTGSGPWQLPVSLRCAAGEERKASLESGTAALIFTGAPLPAGSDCVVMQEQVDRTPEAIVLYRRPDRHENIRFRGEEHAAGSVIVSAGVRVSSRRIAAAASGGHAALLVRRRVRVSVIATGSEVADPGKEGLEGSEIWDVNTPTLRAFLTRPDVELVAVETVPDDIQSICAALHRASRTSDLVVTTGGVSVGEEDHLGAAVQRLEGDVIFAGVAIKPGKPVAFGRIGDAVWLGLPGNPQSAFVTWTLFGEEALRQLGGLVDIGTRKRLVVLTHSIRRKPGRCEVRAARFVGIDGLGRDLVECAAAVQSGRVGSLSTADGLVLLPAEADLLCEGALVEFLQFHSY